MDPIDTWRDLIEKTLTWYTTVPYANADAVTEACFDRVRDRYVLMDVGWRGSQRVHGALVHVDIIEGRIWIQYDGTEQGIATELIEAGVPRDRIVLAFQPPSVRQHSGFAA